MYCSYSINIDIRVLLCFGILQKVWHTNFHITLFYYTNKLANKHVGEFILWRQ